MYLYAPLVMSRTRSAYQCNANWRFVGVEGLWNCITN